MRGTSTLAEFQGAMTPPHDSAIVHAAVPPTTRAFPLSPISGQCHMAAGAEQRHLHPIQPLELLRERPRGRRKFEEHQDEPARDATDG